MRLVVLSTILPLVLGVAACVAPGDESIEHGSAPADEAAADVGTVSPEIAEKSAAIVDRIEGLLKLNRQWNERVRGGATTPEAKQAIEELVKRIRDTLVALPADAEWVTGHVEQHEDALKAGFATEVASEAVKTAIGADQVQKLIDAVKNAGGVDDIILKSAGLVRDHSQDVSDTIGQGKKMPIGYFCGMAGTVAGANAARENWRGVVVPMYVMLRAGCIR